jgi:hypothetical protein
MVRLSLDKTLLGQNEQVALQRFVVSNETNRGYSSEKSIIGIVNNLHPNGTSVKTRIDYLLIVSRPKKGRRWLGFDGTHMVWHSHAQSGQRKKTQK